MERVLQRTPATIGNTWYEDGDAVDPGTVTVDITRADGTVLVTDGATAGATTNPRTFNLTAATHTDILDELTIEWTSSTKGTQTTQVEVVGGFYFTIAQAQAIPGLAEKSAEEIASVRTRAEQAFEDAAGVAFVPRYHRTTLGAASGYELALPKYPVRAIRDVSEVTGIGGTATTVATSGMTYTRSGIYRAAGWTAGPNNVTVGYEYGYDRPPERVAQAVLLLAKNWLIVGPIDDRATGIPAGEAGGVITLATPGVRDDVFGIPEVDATLKQYGRAHSGIYSIPLFSPANSYFSPTDDCW